jgi:hypothetical protein
LQRAFMQLVIFKTDCYFQCAPVKLSFDIIWKI